MASECRSQSRRFRNWRLNEPAIAFCCTDSHIHKQRVSRDVGGGSKPGEKERRDTRIFLRAFRTLWCLTYNSFQKQECLIWGASSKQTLMRSSCQLDIAHRGNPSYYEYGNVSDLRHLRRAPLMQLYHGGSCRDHKFFWCKMYSELRSIKCDPLH